MSLINDALKKASHTHQQQVAAKAPAALQAVGAPPMQTADPKAAPGTSLLIPIVMIMVLLVGGGVVVALIVTKKTGTTVVQAPKVEPKIATPTVSTEPAKSLSVATAQVSPQQAPAIPQAVVVTQPPVAANPTASSPPAAEVSPVVAKPPVEVAVPVAPPAPTFPVIKLQGIFYKKANSTVMLNGKTVSEGGKIDGAVVSKIEPMSVTLEWNGETKVLELQ